MKSHLSRLFARLTPRYYRQKKLLLLQEQLRPAQLALEGAQSSFARDRAALVIGVNQARDRLATAEQQLAQYARDREGLLEKNAELQKQVRGLTLKVLAGTSDSSAYQTLKGEVAQHQAELKVTEQMLLEERAESERVLAKLKKEVKQAKAQLAAADDKFLAHDKREKDYLAKIDLHQQQNKYLERTLKQTQAKLNEATKQIEQGVWEIHDKRTVPSVQVDDSIYGPSLMGAAPDLMDQMRADLNIASKQGFNKRPSVVQEAMVFSDHPATCVIAGAGSGKSTTLALRVIFMVCYMKIPLEEITVVSFTRASCEDLREKFLEAFFVPVWRQLLPPSLQEEATLTAACNKLVRTFHSSLVSLTKTVFPGSGWFDMLKEFSPRELQEQAKQKELEVDDDRHLNPKSMPDGAGGGKLNKMQMDLLARAYRKALATSKEFRSCIHQLLLLQTSAFTALEVKSRKCTAEAASGSDFETVKSINVIWAEDGAAEFMVFEPIPVRSEGYVFYSNGWMGKNKTPVFLSLNGKYNGESIYPALDHTKTINFSTNGLVEQRAKFLVPVLQPNWITVSSIGDLDKTKSYLEFVENDEIITEASPTPPMPRVKLEGEQLCDWIVQDYYAQASFIENLNMEVPHTCARMAGFKQGSMEHLFTKSLAIFWPIFEEVLRDNPAKLMTFNRAFLLLGENGGALPRNIPEASLRPFTHLLVDEFQDISPQIASFLRATQRRLTTTGAKPSLMAIGDDWQSIYGWRGSVPEMFVQFSQHFPIHPSLNGALTCKMMDNYRSVEAIIRDAEQLLKPVQVKINKSSNAIRDTTATDHGILLHKAEKQGSHKKNNALLTDVMAKSIETQLKFVNSLKKTDKNKIIVLAYSNVVINEIKAKTEHLNIRDVLFSTFHRSKGLQAEVAVLCGDCSSTKTHLFRDAVYAASGLFSQSYSSASKDESMRLAYVAATRGIRRVVWHTAETDGALSSLPSKEAPVTIRQAVQKMF